MAYSGAQVTQLRPSGQPGARPAGAFAGKTAVEVTDTSEEGAAYLILKSARSLR